MLEGEQFKAPIKKLKNFKEDAEFAIAEKKRMIQEQEEAEAADFRRKLMIGVVAVGAVGLAAYVINKRR